MSLGASKQRSLDTTHRSTMALSFFFLTIRELPFTNAVGRSLAKLEAKKQKSVKNRKNGIFSQMEGAILDLDYFILIFCLARMEPRRSA